MNQFNEIKDIILEVLENNNKTEFGPRNSRENIEQILIELYNCDRMDRESYSYKAGDIK